MSYNEQTLAHHGIKGQKWGVRRFQKKDGSLTSAGKSRYDDTAAKVGSTLKNLDAVGRTKVGDGLYAKSDHKGQLSDGYQKHKKPGPVMGGPNDNGDAFRKLTKDERKAVRSSMKEMCKKIKNGEVIEGFDEMTGRRLGFFDRRTGEPIKYADVVNAQAYAAKKRATAYIAAVGALTVSSLVAQL